MSKIVSDSDLDLIFREARTHNVWQDKPISDVLLQALYDLLRMGPTSVNCSPARFVFVKSPEAKERLEPALSETNRAKTMAAPVTVIIGHDLDFAEKIPALFPHRPEAKDWFKNPDFAATTAFRNGTLQGAYLIVAARALGLDCGPMSGFDRAKVDQLFLSEQGWRSNFLINLGYGEATDPYPRAPRFDFEEACAIV